MYCSLESAINKNAFVVYVQSDTGNQHQQPYLVWLFVYFTEHGDLMYLALPYLYACAWGFDNKYVTRAGSVLRFVV